MGPCFIVTYKVSAEKQEKQEEQVEEFEEEVEETGKL